MTLPKHPKAEQNQAVPEISSAESGPAPRPVRARVPRFRRDLARSRGSAHDQQRRKTDRQKITNIPSETQLFQPADKEEIAKGIANEIVQSFKYTVWGSLITGLLMIVGTAFIYRNPDATVKTVKESIVPYVVAVSTFASTVFGPLLAFILGYYFGERKPKA